MRQKKPICNKLVANASKKQHLQQDVSESNLIIFTTKHLPMENYYVPRKNWFQRNWKWFVPTGCLGMIVAVVLIYFFLTAVFSGITSMLKDSKVYEHTMKIAKESDVLEEKIGHNIESVDPILGSIATHGNSSDAVLMITIKGSKGKGTIRVIAEKENSVWLYNHMEFYQSNPAETINLLEQ